MPAGKRITKALVDRLEAGATSWDADVRGFGIRRQVRDATYVLKYRVDGRQRFITIGRHGSPWTPETARAEAKRLLGAIHAGDDPAVQRDARKREPSVAEVLERYLAEHVEQHCKPSTAADIRRRVQSNMIPALGDMRISELTRAAVKRWHASFKDRPYEGNRSLAYLRKALAIASKEWELRPDNPASGVTMFPERRRERFFRDDELRSIGKVLAASEVAGDVLPGCIRAIRLLALTGMRLSEVTGMQWDWIDLEAGCVRLPDAKSGARAVPLGGAALAYLASLDRFGAFVCYSPDPLRPLSRNTLEHTWQRLRLAAGLNDARLHDFRHTTGTLTAMTGANAFIVRDVLGHRDLATTQRYVARTVDPLRKVSDQVSGRVAAALNSSDTPEAEILPIRKAP